MASKRKKIALVIGSSGGIGSAIVKRLVQDGFYVCGTYFKGEEKIKALHGEYNEQQVAFYRMDIINQESVRSVMHEILEKYKNIDAVVFSAAAPILHEPFLDAKWNDVQLHINTQLGSAWHVLQCLRDQIHAKYRTKAVMILSEVCFGKPPARMLDYVTAKYALMGFAKAAAVELGRFNCTINMVSPGMVNTDQLASFPSKAVEFTVTQNPLGRIAEPKDVASAVAFLISNDSEYLNGAHIAVNGGNNMI